MRLITFFFMPKIFKILVFLALPILLFCPPTYSQDTEEDLLKIESNLVVLNAAITDQNGEHVSGLKQKEFRILENGVEQEIEFFEAEETPFAAVILLDTSGSMVNRVPLAVSAAINFLDGLRYDDLTAIYSFDSKINLIQDFSNSRDVSHRIYDLKAEGWTVLNDAIYKAAKELENRNEKRKAIIVLSDGEDSRSKRSENKALNAALAADATIYTVDMSEIAGNTKRNIQNRRVLKKFASKTGGTFIKTPGGAELRQAFKSIVTELGTLYTLGYQPKNLKKDGKWRSIELRIKRPNLNIRTREGYKAQKEK